MKNALTYGVLMTLVDSAWMVIQDRWGVLGLARVLIPFAIILGGLYLGIKQKRDEELGGSIAFADACWSGLSITIVFVALDGIATYGYLVLVRPPTNPLRIVMLWSLLVPLVVGTLGSILMGVLLKRPPLARTPGPVGLPWPRSDHMEKWNKHKVAQYTEEQQSLFREQFAARQKRQWRVTIQAGAAVLGSFLIGKADLPRILSLGVALVGVVALFGLLIFSVRNWSCPACNGFLDPRDRNPKFCSRCGAALG